MPVGDQATKDSEPHHPLPKTAVEFDEYVKSVFAEDVDSSGKLVSEKIRKGLLFFIHLTKGKNRKDYMTTAKAVLHISKDNGIISDEEELSLDALKSGVNRTVTAIFLKRSNVKRDAKTIIQILFEEFDLNSFKKKRKRDEPSVSSPPESVPDYRDRPVPFTPSPKKLKTDCSKCKKKRASLLNMASLNRSRKRELEDAHLSTSELRTLRYCHRKRGETLDRFRMERKQLRETVNRRNKEIQRLKDSLAQLPKRHKCKEPKLLVKLAAAQKEITKLKKNCKKLEFENDSLRLAVLEEKGSETELSVKKDGKTYSCGYRKAAYSCLLQQVPVEKVGVVIEDVVQEVTGLTVPSRATSNTVAQFAYELGVLNDVQVCEAVVSEENLTIGWDATSLASEHVNEVHIMFPGSGSSSGPQGLELQINSLAGGTTNDYADHIKESLQDISDSYALCHQVNPVEIQQSVISKLKNTISDRVSVNNCVRQKLEEDLQIELLGLNCNVHPLDGIAGGVRSVLKKIDTAQGLKGDCFGKSCCVDNLIYAISKMRYKQGTGDPKGFKVFLKREGIEPKTIMRYVGNRLHVVFHLAGVFFSLRQKLMEYFTKFCSVTSGFRTAIIKDFSNPSILIHLKVLGLMGKVLTGPWMSAFYGNAENKTNLEVIPELKTAVLNVKQFCDNPLSLLNTDVDVFGHKLLDSDEVRSSLQSPLDPQSVSEFKEVARDVFTSAVTVLERQLSRYLSSDLSEPTMEMLERTKSAPIHNIYSERVLGMTDSQTRRAPNATVGFIDAKVKCAQNKTLAWLKKKDPEEQERLVNFAIRRARDVRLLRKKRDDHRRNIFLKRQDEKKQKRDETAKRKLEKPLKSMTVSHTFLEETIRDFEITLSDEKAKILESVVKDPSVLVNHYIDHYWFQDGENVLYCGKIMKCKTPQSGPYYKISYWQDNEEEADGEDTRMDVHKFLADYVTGDLILV